MSDQEEELSKIIADEMAKEIDEEVFQSILAEVKNQEWEEELMKNPEPTPDFSDTFEVYKTILESGDFEDTTK